MVRLCDHVSKVVVVLRSLIYCRLKERPENLTNSLCTSNICDLAGHHENIFTQGWGKLMKKKYHLEELLGLISGLKFLLRGRC